MNSEIDFEIGMDLNLEWLRKIIRNECDDEEEMKVLMKYIINSKEVMLLFGKEKVKVLKTKLVEIESDEEVLIEWAINFKIELEFKAEEKFKAEIKLKA